ncbi:MAG: PilZ domain-containing protein [Treponema sp.]|jgi:hypothetical protein|nr:PilZ domain-containing protein [Treponema sp.]
MLFNKKQKQAEVEKPPAENRRAVRFSSMATVKINGFEGEALLKDINAGGLCMESVTYASLELDETYVMSISPEPSFGVETFDLKVKVQWLHSSATLFATGFSIIEPPRGHAFQKYIDAVSRLRA